MQIIRSFRRLVPFGLAALVFVGCDQLGCNPDTPGLYETAPRAPSLTDVGIEALDHMGPVIIDQGINFAVYSERATRIDILLFDDPEAE